MTTTVRIDAHVEKSKEVFVSIENIMTSLVPIEEFTLQDGQSAERNIFDDRSITIIERVRNGER